MRSAFDISRALINGAAVASWIAVPDVASGKTARIALKTGILGVAVAGFIPTERDQDAQSLPRAASEDLREIAEDPNGQVGMEPRGIRRQWLIVGGATALSVVSHVVVARGIDISANRLRRRGIRYPRALIGAGARDRDGDRRPLLRLPLGSSAPSQYPLRGAERVACSGGGRSVGQRV
ncbi:hypothetical protein GCM10009788_16830 [Nocardioides humi]|uniref:Uncharacterized protein n=1 Tax=Nocardioides humi TaxID=449461 RepID=A0ABN2A762_9ACTN